MGRTVLMNAGPWLPVPPGGYGGIETVVAALIPELRRRGVRVLLCTVGTPGVEVDGSVSSFPEPQFPRLAEPYGQAVGVAHAHMQHVLAMLDRHSEIDLVHDHLEVVGPSVLTARREGPPVLQTLHWDLRKHADFYATFEGRGRVFFSGVSATQLADAPPNLAAQTLGVAPLALDMAAYEPCTRKDDFFLTLGRFTWAKGPDVAARACKELGVRLLMAGPVAGVATPDELAARLADSQDPIRDYADVAYYLDAVRIYEDGERITWIGSVGGPEKHDLLRRASALLLPIRWNEPGGTAAIEALACGTPVVTNRSGALSSIVQHGVNGFLADDEREFTDLLPRVRELDPLACRRSVEDRFSASIVVDRYLELYEEVLVRARR